MSQQSGTAGKVEDIKNEIVSNLNGRCECGISISHITNSRLLCPGGDKPAVTFRAKLHGTLNSPVHELSNYLEEWLRVEGSFIVVQSIQYGVINFCSANISSSIEEVCNNISATSVTTTQGPGFIVAIIGGVAAVSAVLILAVISGLVICVVVCAKMRHTSENLR